MGGLIYYNVHSLSQPGAKSSTKIINAGYIWPNIQKDVRKRNRECSVCQLPKVNRHTNPLIGVFSQSFARFAHAHVCLVGSLPLFELSVYVYRSIHEVSYGHTSNEHQRRTNGQDFHAEVGDHFGTPILPQ